MAIFDGRCSVTLHRNTVKRIEAKRCGEINRSWVVDRDLTRFYALMDSIPMPSVFTASELRKLRTVLNDEQSRFRNGSIKSWRSLFQDSPELSDELKAKLRKLTDVSLLKVLDTLEQQLGAHCNATA